MSTSIVLAGLRRRVMLSLAALAMLAGTAASAQERLLLAGVEIADAAYYGYVGTVLPLGKRHDGRGWFQRYWVDGFGYEYDGGPGRVEATAYGLEAALGYGGGDERGWWGVSAGLRYTDTSLDPDDPDATARGSQTGAKFQLEGEQRLAGQWRVNGIASVTTEQGSYWARGRAMHGPPSRSFGVEAVVSGNDEADAVATGLVASIQPAGSKWSVGVKAGYRFQDDADGVYGGVELGYAF
jgi:hypothetical protein